MRRASTAEGALFWSAGVVIVGLTGAAFWLSYAHLAEVAAGHGLGGSTARAWAWPATLDLFIVAGELLILRAALAGRGVDWWAIGLTVAGSGGSISLNVAGVGSAAEALDYIVAAVPPSAALLAFGALMRQLHEHLSRRAAATPPAAPDAPAFEAASVGLPAVPPLPPADTWQAVAWPVEQPAQPRSQPVAAAGQRRNEVTARYTPQPDPEPSPGAQPTVAVMQPDAVDDGPDLDPDPLLEQARGLDDASRRHSGRPISQRQLQARLHIGQRRAQRIRAQLDRGEV